MFSGRINEVGRFADETISLADELPFIHSLPLRRDVFPPASDSVGNGIIVVEDALYSRLARRIDRRVALLVLHISHLNYPCRIVVVAVGSLLLQEFALLLQRKVVGSKQSG